MGGSYLVVLFLEINREVSKMEEVIFIGGSISAAVNILLVTLVFAYHRNETRLIKEIEKDQNRLNWLDLHTNLVADGEYVIGPYKIGELRKMADDGIAIDAANKEETANENT